jgi:predicted nuclease of predicted toxin-antitoxin system
VKFKLDENLSRSAGDLIRTAGHDTVTVAGQGLRGAADEILFEVCGRERRALVTLDRDFGQVLRYPPAASAGIVIIAAIISTARVGAGVRSAEEAHPRG